MSGSVSRQYKFLHFRPAHETLSGQIQIFYLNLIRQLFRLGYFVAASHEASRHTLTAVL